MPCYIISYDLRGTTKNYDSLYEAIKSYKKWAKINESTWAVVTTSTAVQIRDNILSHLDTDDRIFVIKSGIESAWQNPICTTAWLKENL